MLHQIVRTAIRRAAQNGTRSSSHKSIDFRPPTMDELPIPQGSWQKNYDQKQKLYNIQLAAGIICVTSTITFIYNADFIIFNFFPPKEDK